MVATVRALAGGDEADRRLFNLLYHALDALETREAGHEAMRSAFALKLSTLAGYAPQLDACLSCDLDLDEADAGILYYAPDLGGALCRECRSENPAVDAFPVPPGTLAALRALMRRPLKDVSLEDGLEGGVRRVVSAHVLAHAPGNAALSARPSSLRPA
jgi:DNA repair protein RecO (recombination protein O)